MHRKPSLWLGGLVMNVHFHVQYDECLSEEVPPPPSFTIWVNLYHIYSVVVSFSGQWSRSEGQETPLQFQRASPEHSSIKVGLEAVTWFPVYLWRRHMIACWRKKKWTKPYSFKNNNLRRSWITSWCFPSVFMKVSEVQRNSYFTDSFLNHVFIPQYFTITTSK